MIVWYFPMLSIRPACLHDVFRKKNSPTHAFVIINGAEKYHPLVSELNALIDDYETGIERRLSTGAEETDEENELNQDLEEAAE
ncbi:MAG: hypothetical protein V5A51_10550 [Bacteroidales bacterium]